MDEMLEMQKDYLLGRWKVQVKVQLKVRLSGS